MQEGAVDLVLVHIGGGGGEGGASVQEDILAIHLQEQEFIEGEFRIHR